MRGAGGDLGLMLLEPGHDGERLAGPDLLLDMALNFGGNASAAPAVDQGNAAGVGGDERIAHRHTVAIDEIDAAAITGRRDGNDVGRIRAGFFQKSLQTFAGGTPHAVGIALRPAVFRQKHDIRPTFARQLIAFEIEQHDFRHGAAGIDSDQAFAHDIPPRPFRRLLNQRTGTVTLLGFSFWKLGYWTAPNCQSGL